MFFHSRSSNMAHQEQQVDYYSSLEEKIETNKLQGKYKNYKKVGDKAMVYVRNGQNRRNIYRNRAATLVQRAMELEVLTHCKVSVQVTSRHPSGKSHGYHSQLPWVDDQQLAPAQPMTPATPAREEVREEVHVEAEDVEMADAEPYSTPRKRRRVTPTPRRVDLAPEEQPGPSASTAPDVNKCRECEEGDKEGNKFWWVGCSHKPNKRHTCRYWVHQGCIGLKFSQKNQLDKVPFFCPNHI
ncbi:uncharacterized protein [Amphiura filiformis]|uniref:uncharacterized protein n=1 Tax=Amphiura filiformis TaxID=82378 RepID=UPI003B20F673